VARQAARLYVSARSSRLFAASDGGWRDASPAGIGPPRTAPVARAGHAPARPSGARPDRTRTAARFRRPRTSPAARASEPSERRRREILLSPWRSCGNPSPVGLRPTSSPQGRGSGVARQAARLCVSARSSRLFAASDGGWRDASPAGLGPPRAVSAARAGDAPARPSGSRPDRTRTAARFRRPRTPPAARASFTPRPPSSRGSPRRGPEPRRGANPRGRRSRRGPEGRSPNPSRRRRA